MIYVCIIFFLQLSVKKQAEVSVVDTDVPVTLESFWFQKENPLFVPIETHWVQCQGEMDSCFMHDAPCLWETVHIIQILQRSSKAFKSFE